MKFEEAYEQTTGTGWLTKPEAELLWRAASSLSGDILEVGCYHGKSTCLLARLGRPMHCVDPFDNFDSDDLSGDLTYVKFMNNIAERGISNVSLYRQKIETWPMRPCGFAYLDGDHTYEGTVSQLKAAIQCGTYEICLHDYADNGEGFNIVKAVAVSPYRVVEVVGRMAHCVRG